MAELPPLDELRNAAREHFRGGKFDAAIRTQVDVVNRVTTSESFSVSDHKALALYLFASGKPGAAAKVLETGLPMLPADDEEYLRELGVSLLHAGRAEEALAPLLKARTLNRNHAGVHDALAAVFARLERFSEAEKCGEVSLLLKAKSAKSGKAWPTPRKRKSSTDDQCRLIAFSLWQEREAAWNAAVEQAALARNTYPDWTCRFYCAASLPEAVGAALRRLGAEVARVESNIPAGYGMFWKYHALAEAGVSHVLFRDCEIRLAPRETLAVGAWLASGKRFHVMRDWYTHSELIVPGLWGAVTGTLPGPEELLKGHQLVDGVPREVEAHFLAQRVWPTARRSCLVHDSVFRVLAAKPFPGKPDVSPAQRVGAAVTPGACGLGDSSFPD